ncbi:MAG TPA: Holliday junction branch migration protein RuvA [Fimbriimonadaceae bacterium]|nr:Holliday junction branch migration protein RuvA [Fimbriimonadaceae bacterium]
MIARLRGEVIEVGTGRVTVDAGGVGYEVLVPESVLLAVGREGAQVDLRIRHVFREDGQVLFGFLNSDQRRLFDLLTDVKGCGAKTSLAMISELGEIGAVSAIATQDLRMIARTPGIGMKLAERIAIELRDKVAELSLVQRAAVKIEQPEDEVVDALLALGYRRQEAEIAASEVRREGDSVEVQIKSALRRLAR